jgi:hypothetical protein
VWTEREELLPESTPSVLSTTPACDREHLHLTSSLSHINDVLGTPIILNIAMPIKFYFNLFHTKTKPRTRKNHASL